METRNTPLLREIITVLATAGHIEQHADAVECLEDHFRGCHALFGRVL